MKAVIFDMDGVISDTQVLHANTESAMLEEHGINLHPDEITRRFAGVPDEVAFPEIFTEAGMELHDLSEFLRHKWEKMFAASRESITPVPGALEIITALHSKGVPLAVASSSPVVFIEHVLQSLDIRSAFQVITSGDEVAHGKPAPDVFLLAAQRLGVEPTDCVVIEDGLSGMQGAKAAGMKCVALLTHVRAEDSPADLQVTDLRKLTIDEILA